MPSALILTTLYDLEKRLNMLHEAREYFSVHPECQYYLFDGMDVVSTGDIKYIALRWGEKGNTILLAESPNVLGLYE